MKVLVFGNCQARPIGHFIRHAADYPIEIIELPPVHLLDKTKPDVIDPKFLEADIILSQPIGNGFGEISSDKMREKHKKTWISFPSIYFGGLFPYLINLRTENGNFPGPLKDYHDRRIISSFISGRSEKECVDTLSEQNLDYCLNFFKNAKAESQKREESLDIKVMPMVDQFCSSGRRAFHVFNHPTNEVLWHVAVEFLKLIGIPIRNEATPWLTQMLSNVQAAIAPEIISHLNINKTEGHFKVDGLDMSINKLVEKCYDVYRSEINITNIFSRNNVISNH